uniref:Uncharacterized protein n=1 Tax=Parascaris univalens TaxID=6257 RepID=A0A915B5V4_PARUN
MCFGYCRCCENAVTILRFARICLKLQPCRCAGWKYGKYSLNISFLSLFLSNVKQLASLNALSCCSFLGHSYAQFEDFCAQLEGYNGQVEKCEAL